MRNLLTQLSSMRPRSSALTSDRVAPPARTLASMSMRQRMSGTPSTRMLPPLLVTAYRHGAPGNWILVNCLMVRVVVGITAAGSVSRCMRSAAAVVMNDRGAPSRCSTHTVGISAVVLNALRE
ncbi:Uncharacterised protein [Mycobacteroides abscessus subsp. abscessus]|nr:Uncharacterised protein [Mycobacteroides abscessus subsp. abscessus]